MWRIHNSGTQFPAVVPEKAADRSSRLDCVPRISSVGSPVVVPEKAADHTSRLNPQKKHCNPKYKNTVPKRYPDD